MIPTKTTSSRGDEYWELPNGKYHREGGPAITWRSGNMYWYFNGICHREDGPAVIYADGSPRWWLGGSNYDFDGYITELKRSYGKTDEDIMLLRMQYDID